jgi:hypothetical protein
MEKLYVNNSEFMEFLCEVATQIVVQKFGEDTWEHNDEGTTFAEEAQDFFNERYDELETLASKTFN